MENTNTQHLKHMTIDDANNIAELMKRATNSDTTHAVLALCNLVDIKDDLLREERYEELTDLKLLEELWECTIPVKIGNA